MRCRNVKALFAACYDADALEQLADLDGKYVAMTTTAAGAVSWTEVSQADASSSDSNSGSLPQNLSIQKPKWCKKYAVGMDEFADGVVGAKSRNLAGLRNKLPEWINLPPSVALPFGSFDAALESNKEVANELKAAVKDVHGGNLTGLERAREIIMGMNVPDAARKELEAGMLSSGIPVPKDEEAWCHALRSLKAVWASKYNERAYTSTKRVGLDFNDVSMAGSVLSLT